MFANELAEIREDQKVNIFHTEQKINAGQNNSSAEDSVARKTKVSRQTMANEELNDLCSHIHEEAFAEI